MDTSGQEWTFFVGIPLDGFFEFTMQLPIAKHSP